MQQKLICWNLKKNPLYNLNERRNGNERRSSFYDLNELQNGIVKRWISPLKNQHQYLCFVNTKGNILSIKYNVVSGCIEQLIFKQIKDFDIKKITHIKKILFLYVTPYKGKESVYSLVQKHGQGKLDVFFT